MDAMEEKLKKEMLKKKALGSESKKQIFHRHHYGIALVLGIIVILAVLLYIYKPAFPAAGEAYLSPQNTLVSPSQKVSSTALSLTEPEFQQKVKKVIKDSFAFRKAEEGRTCTDICKEKRLSPPAKKTTDCLAVIYSTIVNAELSKSLIASYDQIHGKDGFVQACDSPITAADNTLCTCI